MLWTLLALASLVALGGFIAYYGDLQGRRWGKKRVSWFGLRPKHTAILITSLTGAFISLLSIVTLLAINQPLREAILNGETAIRENKRLNSQLVIERIQSENSLNESRSREQIARANYENASRAAADKQRQLERLNAKLADLNTHIQKLLAQYSALQQQYFREQRAVLAEQNKNRKLHADNQELTQLNETAGKINEAIGKQNVDLARQKIELSKNNQKLKQANARLTEGNKTLLTVRDQQIEKNAELSRQNAALAEANKQLLGSNRDLEQQARDLQARIAQLNQEYASLSGERLNIARSYLALRQGKFSLRAGAELARRTFDAHLRPEAVRARLSDLLDEASAMAITHGAVRADNGRAVRIVTKRFLLLAGQMDADERASVDALVDRLTASDTPVVVVANAVNNSVEGEQVLIELTPFAVRRVFGKGERVASCVINARQPTDRIFDSIVQFLNQDVRDAALKAGTIPQTDPETGQRRVGSIETSDLLKLTERIRRMNGQVLLTAIAKEETTSADPLRLDFKLSRPAEGS
ncbi:MAG TPA: DUF3084 domain-containing protein [Chthonomonadaceae bacterium]|nr:DUF3084 domain-containing protein [Chthonomonadaceae bacterium]